MASSGAEALRIHRMNQAREAKLREAEEAKQESDRHLNEAGVRQFAAAAQDTVLEHAFKNETIGLVTLEEFQTKRDTLQERKMEEASKRKREIEDARLDERDKRRKEKDQAAGRSKLSFGDDDEEEEEVVLLAKPATRTPRLGKNPSVATHFLHDKDREEAEEALKQQLRKEWLAKQEEVRSEPVEITFSYWDGQGHRRKVVVRKGATVLEFLKQAREELCKSFRQLRHTSMDNMMYVKEDLIIPHSCTFYDLIINKARGKSGPLFDFGVRDDVRLVADARVERDESHAGKVVEKHWYDKNKHIYPANRWEVYEPGKDYGAYKIGDMPGPGLS